MRGACLLMFISLLAGCTSTTNMTPDTPLTVLVYNIHAGKDAAGVDNLERVAALITEQKADLVLLQEVDRGTVRSGNVDQLETLMRLTGMHGVFGKSLDYQGGLYGIATLSRWPITANTTVPLRLDPPQPRAGGSVEPRVALFVETNSIGVVNTHFDASKEDTWRRQETADLLTAIMARDSRPLFAGGDFNSTPESVVQETLRSSGLIDLWPLCGSGDELTYPAGKPVKRIDYLFVTRKVECVEGRVLDTTASDHRPVVYTVRLQ